MPPERAPDHQVTYETSPDQALVYRLSGDRNPLHSDPSFAAMGGFDRPILHGLCTYGFTGRALLHTLAGSDPARFQHMEGRFSAPVLPGDALTVSIWTTGDGEAVFTTATQDGTVVIDQGLCRSACQLPPLVVHGVARRYRREIATAADRSAAAEAGIRLGTPGAASSSPPRCSARAWRSSTAPWSTSRSPPIADDLGADLSQLQWVISAYLLTLGSLLVLGGSLGDLYGRRKVFVIGLTGFALTSALCAVAPTADLLIVARLLQGAAAALLVPGSLAMISASFHPDDRRSRHRDLVGARGHHDGARPLRRRVVDRLGVVAAGVPDQPAPVGAGHRHRRAPRARDP